MSRRSKLPNHQTSGIERHPSSAMQARQSPSSIPVPAQRRPSLPSLDEREGQGPFLHSIHSLHCTRNLMLVGSTDGHQRLNPIRTTCVQYAFTPSILDFTSVPITDDTPWVGVRRVAHRTVGGAQDKITKPNHKSGKEKLPGSQCRHDQTGGRAGATCVSAWWPRMGTNRTVPYVVRGLNHMLISNH